MWAWQSGPYTARQRAALEFTERFIYDHQSIDDDVLARLRAHLDDGELVELGLFVASHLGVGRLLAILDVEPDA